MPIIKSNNTSIYCFSQSREQWTTIQQKPAKITMKPNSIIKVIPLLHWHFVTLANNVHKFPIKYNNS